MSLSQGVIEVLTQAVMSREFDFTEVRVAEGQDGPCAVGLFTDKAYIGGHGVVFAQARQVGDQVRIECTVIRGKDRGPLAAALNLCMEEDEEVFE